MDEIQKKHRDYYNENAHKWAALKTNSFYHEDNFRKFAAHFQEGDSIIDIGCGWGIHIPLFLGIGRKLKYEGIDISEEMIKIAQSRFPQLDFSIGNILEEDTLPKKKFNGFWASAILMHIPKENWPKLLDNLRKLTVSGGIGYLTLLDEKFEDNPDTSDPRYFEIINDKEFKKIASQQSLQILEQGELPKTIQNRGWRWYILKLP